MQLTRATEILTQWGIQRLGFETYIKLCNNGNLNIDEDLIEQTAVDYLNLRLSFVAIHNEPLNMKMNKLYRSEDGLFYPSLSAYWDYLSLIKHGVPLNGKPRKVKEQLVQDALKRDKENKLQWFHDKYSEKPIEIITKETFSTNIANQLENFYKAIEKGDIYPHYRINNLVLQNDFSLLGAYRYLRTDSSNTLESFLSIAIAVATTENFDFDQITLNELIYSGQLVFTSLNQLRNHYIDTNRVSLSWDSYEKEHGNTKGFVEHLNDKIKRAYLRTLVGEFKLKSLVLPSNPTQPIESSVIKACQEEAKIMYRKGIEFAGELFSTRKKFLKALEGYTLSDGFKTLIDEVFKKYDNYVNLDEEITNKGYTVAKRDKLVYLASTDSVTDEFDKFSFKTKKYTILTDRITTPKKLATSQKEEEFKMHVNEFLTALDLSPTNFKEFIELFEGVDFRASLKIQNSITVNSDAENYHIMAELYINLVIQYMMTMDKLPNYSISSIDSEKVKLLDFATALKGAIDMGIVTNDFECYIKYTLLHQNPQPILDMITEIQEELAN